MKMDIKPCPFCGERAFASWSNDNESVNIRCLGWGIDCGGQSMWFDSEDQAVYSWNTRHIPDGYSLVRVEPNKGDLIIQSWTSNQTNGWILSVPNGIKITHIPTGFTAFCESERSQHKNREIAIAEIKAMIAAAQDETE